MHMYLDVVGSCNLKCPSCPIGNSVNNNSKRAMTVELFEKVVAKAVGEGIRSIYLFNWTEPLLHPKIGKFIEIVQGAGIQCGISSNLNIRKNLEGAIKANPSFFRVSLSGFSQEGYELGHAGGDINKVKENMTYLAELKASFGATTLIEVYYHRYLDNIDEEQRMRAFSEALGFKFSSAFATLMPLEKTLDVAEHVISKITGQDLAVMDRLALPPSEKVLEIAKSYGISSCNLRDGMVVLDCEANVVLCCTVFEQGKYSVGNYLDFPLAELQVKKNTSSDCRSLCGRCISNGLNVYAQYPNTGPLLNYAVGQSVMRHMNILVPSAVASSEASGLEQGENDFNEVGYLAANPDVALAVRNGLFSSGYQHYLKYGRNENRSFS